MSHIDTVYVDGWIAAPPIREAKNAFDLIASLVKLHSDLSSFLTVEDESEFDILSLRGEGIYMLRDMDVLIKKLMSLDVSHVDYCRSSIKISTTGSKYATSVSLNFRVALPTPYLTVLQESKEFIEQCCDQLGAYSAFMSDRSSGSYGGQFQTEFESLRLMTPVIFIEEARSYLRGSYWFTFLGSDICTKLGGEDFVLTRAPAESRNRVAHGVSSTASNHPPSSEDSIAALTQFFESVFGTSRQRLAMRESILSNG